MESCIILKNKISYYDKGKGIPILFLPGLDGKCDIWQNQIDELALNFRVIAVDFSNINPGFITMHNMMKLIHEFIDFLELQNLFIAGYNIGALFALAYTSRHPDMICGVATSSLGNISITINDISKYYHINYNPPKGYFKMLFDKLFRRYDLNSHIISKFAGLLKYHIIIQEYGKVSLPLLIINGELDHLSVHNISSSIYSDRKKFTIELEVIEKARKDCFYYEAGSYNYILSEFIENNLTPP